jgi:hypothetical protein
MAVSACFKWRAHQGVHQRSCEEHVARRAGHEPSDDLHAEIWKACVFRVQSDDGRGGDSAAYRKRSLMA